MAGYLGAIPVPQATQHRESFTATSGQTTFNTAGYTVGFLDVYLNGSHLSPADFTATNGSDVVLASGASTGDVCDIISYTAFEVNSQTFTGTTTLDGAVVINESSADVDFRVESNGNANMLFVDGGNDAVGIKTNTPATNGQFSVRGAIATASYGNVSGDFSDATTGSLKISHASGVVKLITDQTLSFRTGTSVEGLKIDATGAITKPLQPAFLAQPASAQENIAVDTSVAVVFGTERFDQGGDFSGNTFTAPVTGKYQLNVGMYLNNVPANATYVELSFKTSNRNYSAGIFSSADAHTYFGLHHSGILTDMDAGDTAYIAIVQGGASSTQQADIQVGTFFSGYLVA